MKSRLTSTALLCAALLLAAPAGRTQGPGLFGSDEHPAATLAALPLWRAVLARIAAERDDYRRCASEPEWPPGCGSLRARGWRELLASGGRAVDETLLWEVNATVNAFRAEGDTPPWSSPRELLRSGGGGEALAVMKYATLRELGMEDARLRIVVGRDVLADRPLTLLVAELGGEHYVLDPRNNSVRRDRAVSYYLPLASFNAAGRWLHLPPGGAP